MSHIEDNYLRRLCNCVERRLGLCIQAGDVEAFRKTMLARMKTANILEPEEYLRFLEADTPGSRLEWKTLALLLTTGESYFFRDKGHFLLLQNTILPDLLRTRQKRRSLRIWSAGCATGEEPYSVAILLDMLLPDRKGWEITIIGTDINEDFLNKAEAGIYTPWSFRAMDRNIQREYFTNIKEDWRISEKINRMVTFKCGNLLDDGYYLENPEICDIDLIICRNVFIYFNRGAVASVCGNFVKILNDEGYLVSGHGELQGHHLKDMCQILYPEAVIYKKSVSNGEAIEVAAQETRKVKRSAPVKPRPYSRPALSQKPVRKIVADPRAEIEGLISKGSYSEAITKIDKYLLGGMDRHDMICLLANAYANSGDYEKAAGACREAMKINPATPEPYFLLAHLAEAKGKEGEAKELLRKALYLNPAFVAAYCELAGLYEKENDLPRARTMRASAMELLKALPAKSMVRPYDITAGELLEYLAGFAGPAAVGLGGFTK